MHILALFAHPDDVEYACGGTLLKYRQAGHKIFIALMTSGNTGAGVGGSREALAQVREAEQLQAANDLDAQVFFLRFDEDGLFDSPQSRKMVLTAIRWANPDVILTHHPQDFIADHSVTAKLVTEVLLSVGGKLHSAELAPIDKQPVVFFASPMAEIGAQSQLFVDITEQQAGKQALLCYHKSQFPPEGPDQRWQKPDERSRVVDHMRGNWCGFPYAEGFTAHQILGYCADYRLLP